MTRSTRRFQQGALTAAVAAILAAPASAQPSQSAPPPQQLNTTADTSGQPPAPIPTVQPALGHPYWSSTAGFEFDTHDTGYGFFGPTYVRPFRPGVAFVAGGNFNYLYYQFPSGDGHTNVRAPGVSVRGGVKFGEKNYVTLSAGPGFKRRHTEMMDGTHSVIRTIDDTLVGVDVGADVWVDPTSHNNVFAMVDYNTLDNYTWSRLAYKEQVGNHNWSGRFTPYVGAEVVGQGNRDIRSTQAGAFVELVHVPSSVSVMVRGGYKRSVYTVGPARTGPWVAIGFYQRLGAR